MKFKWETQTEYEYRTEMNKTAEKMGKILANTEKIAQQKKPDYKETIESIIKEINRLKRMVVPTCYDNIHLFLLEGYSYYLKGYQLLINKELNDNIINKAALFINCGNSFSRITTVKNLELLEGKQDESK